MFIMAEQAERVNVRGSGMARNKTNGAEERTALLRYVRALQGTGLKVTVQPAGRGAKAGARRHVDAWLRLGDAGVAEDWAGELKIRIDPRTLGPVIHQMKALQHDVRRAILLTEYVAPGAAEELRKHGIAFVDAAGNAFLQDKGLFVWVTGKKQDGASGGQRRGLHAAGLKLLFILLRGECKDATYRGLAEEAGIALGGVGWILRELRQRGWVRRTGPTGLVLQDAPAMLERWDEGYADTLRPKLFIRTCRMNPGAKLQDLERQLVKTRLARQVRIGGELGAALLTKHLKPVTATLHIGQVEADEVMRRMDLLPDRAGDVHLLKGFGTDGALAEQAPKRVRLVDPLLIRAELLVRPDDRLIEVAETLRTNHIEPRWK
jgi:hypothetical protein